MEVGVLSMRYAKAMIDYAQEKGVEDRLYNEFFTLSHSFRVQPGSCAKCLIILWCRLRTSWR